MSKADTFKLTEQERGSALWQRLKAHIESRLESHRRKNDNDAPDEKTAKLRGRIAECKILLALDKPIPVVPDDN